MVECYVRRDASHQEEFNLGVSWCPIREECWRT